MNKYKKELEMVCEVYAIIHLRELVEREQNGIYISNEKVAELLEALKRLGNCRIETGFHTRRINGTSEYKILITALGGNNE